MKNLKIKNNRILIQLTILIVVIIAELSHNSNIFHYICPICGVSSIYQFFVSSTLWVVKLKSLLGITIGIVLIATILFGPILCGFICPFGTIQDLVAKLGNKMFKRKYNHFLPKNLEHKMKYIRYISLVLTIAITSVSTGVIFLEKINPYHAFLGVFSKSISIVGFFVLCIIILLSLFIHRPWCKYICPYGALLGIFNRFKVFRIVRNKSTCVGCKKCSNICPMGIDVHTNDEVRDLSCISCLECVSDKVCKKERTIFLTSKDLDEIFIEENEVNSNTLENLFEGEFKRID